MIRRIVPASAVLAFLAIAGLLLAGCAAENQVNAAARALSSAKTAHADVLAPYEFTSAELYLEEATAQLHNSDFDSAGRFADKARTMALTSEQKAREAYAKPMIPWAQRPEGAVAPAPPPAAIAPKTPPAPPPAAIAPKKPAATTTPTKPTPPTPPKSATPATTTPPVKATPPPAKPTPPPAKPTPPPAKPTPPPAVQPPPPAAPPVPPPPPPPPKKKPSQPTDEYPLGDPGDEPPPSGGSQMQGGAR